MSVLIVDCAIVERTGNFCDAVISTCKLSSSMSKSNEAIS